MRGALDVCERRSGVTAVLFVANGFVIVSFVAVVLWYYTKQKSKHIVQWMPCTLPLIQFAMRAEETLRRTMDPDITDEEEVDLRYEWSHFLPAANGRLFTKGTAYTVRKRIRQAGLTFGDAVRKLEERFARERGDTRDEETLVDLSIAPDSPVVRALAIPDVHCIVSISDNCDVASGGAAGGDGRLVTDCSRDGGGDDNFGDVSAGEDDAGSGRGISIGLREAPAAVIAAGLDGLSRIDGVAAQQRADTSGVCVDASIGIDAPTEEKLVIESESEASIGLSDESGDTSDDSSGSLLLDLRGLSYDHSSESDSINL